MQAKAAEQAMVVSAILARETLDRCSKLLPEHFGDPTLSGVWRAMLELHREGIPITIPALELHLGSARAKELRLRDVFTAMDPESTPDDATTNADLVRDAANRRTMAAIAVKLEKLALDTSRPVVGSVQEIATQLSELRAGNLRAKSIRQVLDEVWAEVQARASGVDDAPGIATGLQALDGKLTFGGLPRSQVSVLAGATSSGKSALANTCLLAAAKRGRSVLCCALEDDARAVAKRLLSQMTGVCNHQLQRGIVSEAERPALVEALGTLARTRVDFLERIPADISELTATIREHVRDHETELVIVDFLQLLRTTQHHRTRQDVVDHIFGELVAMAREIPAATLVVSQLKRTGDRAPTKEDLYHSGALEQWSHTVALLWRPELPDYPDMVSLIVAKQKNGPVGRIGLGWHAATVSYCNADHRRADDYAAALNKLPKERPRS
jgi:replicative DNA helicase